MPGLFKRQSPEDAPIGDPAPAHAPTAIRRTQPLTLELLDWLIHALEAVLTTPEVNGAGRRVQTSLSDALKLADHLYPLTKEAQDAALLSRTAGRDAADSSSGDL